MSKRFFIASSFDVFELDLEYWDYPKHRHNFFELVFIKSGNGIHNINDSSFEYDKGDVFLLTPNDEHEFTVHDRTLFGYLKFTEQIFLEKSELVSDLKWIRNIDAVVLHANSIPGSIMRRESDRELVFELFDLLKREFKDRGAYSRSILLELFGALLMILSRNISNENIPVTLSEKDRVSAILTYLRQNVLDAERTKIAAIAEAFNMSPNYVSVFIKKHAGISIQNYVMRTKMKMAERLLGQTTLNFSQIAQKMGFTDSSHFTKAFKKYKGMTPKMFRAGKI